MGAPAVAEYLGLTLRSVYKLIDRAEFPAYRLGRVIRIKKADVDAYLERVRVEPGSLRRHYNPDSRGKGDEKLCD